MECVERVEVELEENSSFITIGSDPVVSNPLKPMGKGIMGVGGVYENRF